MRDFILENNTYFNKGYSEVYQDDITGVIYGFENGTPKHIFPNDGDGDYFYLRLPKSVSFDYNSHYKIDDCQAGLGLKTSVILVACVRDADSSKLFNNLIITLRNYKTVDMSIKTGLFQSVEVIMQELSKVSPETKIEALKTHDGSYTIVSLTLEATVALMPRNIDCIINPCKSC